MKLTRRFAFLLIVLLVSVGVSAFAGLYSLRQQHHALEVVMKEGTGRLLLVTDIRRLFRAMTVREDEQILETNDRDALAIHESADAIRAELVTTMATYASIMPDDDRDAAAALRRAFERWVELDDRVVALARAHESGDAYLLSKSHATDPVSWEKLAAQLVAANETRLSAQVAAAGDTYRVGRTVLLTSSLFAMLFAWTVGSAVFHGIRRTVSDLFILNTDLEGVVSTRTRDLEVARAESVAASRAKSDFLANMSHEIRTPMTAVLGYADLLLDPTLTNRDRLEHVETIRRNGTHLLQIINDILDLSKIEAGKMNVELLPCSPSKVLAEVASLMRLRAKQKGLDFEVTFSGAVPASVHSDAVRLRQIVVNLVGNAIKFTERGSVRVFVRCSGAEGPFAMLVVQVVDTGIGLSPEQISSLFQPFSQADSSTSRRFGGSGLGLTICKRLAGLLGGEMTVQSAIGRGSVFTLAVPTGDLTGVAMQHDASEGLLATEVKTAHTPTALTGVRVLLAEDGPDNQRLIARYLVRSGADVTVVENGRLAADAARAGAFDVVLMDMQMPELDGYGATSLLRHEGYTRPIIALTAHSMAGDRERCIRAGCDDFLTKPISRDALLDGVAHWARVPRGHLASEAPAA